MRSPMRCAGFDLPRLEEAVTAIDEDGLALAGIEHRLDGYGEGGGHGNAELDIHVHVRLEQEPGVIHFQPHFEGAGGGVDLRLNVIHAGGEAASRVVGERNARGLPFPNGGASYSNTSAMIQTWLRSAMRVEIGVRHDLLACKGLALDDVAAAWERIG